MIFFTPTQHNFFNYRSQDFLYNIILCQAFFFKKNKKIEHFKSFKYWVCNCRDPLCCTLAYPPFCVCVCVYIYIIKEEKHNQRKFSKDIQTQANLKQVWYYGGWYFKKILFVYKYIKIVIFVFIFIFDIITSKSLKNTE